MSFILFHGWIKRVMNVTAWLLSVCGYEVADMSVCVTSKSEKSIWWMPWHQEAKKDVARCEKPRGVASKL